MKKRRIFIGMFLLVAAAFLGLGFAELTNNLTIGGTLSAEANNDNLKVEFVAHETHALRDGVEDTTFTISVSESGQTATINVNQMSMVGQTAEVIFKVQNNSEALDSLTAVLDPVFTIGLGGSAVDSDGDSENNEFDGDHFFVKVEYLTKGEAGEGEKLASGTHAGKYEIQANEQVYVKVTIRLDDAVVGTLDDHPLTISFNAKTAE